MAQYLIGYDISDPKRLQRIYRKMTHYATPIQYSIFLLDGSEKLLKQCLAEIMLIFNKKEDDLRVYPLPTNTTQWRLGKSSLPEGIIWTALPTSLTLYARKIKITGKIDRTFDWFRKEKTCRLLIICSNQEPTP